MSLSDGKAGRVCLQQPRHTTSVGRHQPQMLCVCVHIVLALRRARSCSGTTQSQTAVPSALALSLHTTVCLTNL